MKRSLLGALVVVVGLTISAAGQSNPQKFTGHLVDAVCAGNHATEPGYAEKRQDLQPDGRLHQERLQPDPGRP